MAVDGGQERGVMETPRFSSRVAVSDRQAGYSCYLGSHQLPGLCINAGKSRSSILFYCFLPMTNVRKGQKVSRSDRHLKKRTCSGRERRAWQDWLSAAEPAGSVWSTRGRPGESQLPKSGRARGPAQSLGGAAPAPPTAERRHWPRVRCVICPRRDDWLPRGAPPPQL